MFNGISQEFAVDDSDDTLVLKFAAWTQDGTAKVAARAVFRNAAGVTLSTQTVSHTVSCPTRHDVLRSEFSIPNGAVTATVLVGASNGVGSDPDVEIASTGPFVLLELFSYLNPAGSECPSPSCDSQISCDEDESAQCICSNGDPPDCAVIDECWCEKIPDVCHWEL